jgi:hypothetical protein
MGPHQGFIYLLFNTETIRPMSIKIKVSVPLGIEEKQQVLR